MSVSSRTVSIYFYKSYNSGNVLYRCGTACAHVIHVRAHDLVMLIIIFLSVCISVSMTVSGMVPKYGTRLQYMHGICANFGNENGDV